MNNNRPATSLRPSGLCYATLRYIYAVRCYACAMIGAILVGFDFVPSLGLLIQF
jgi:hypothetical protein